MAFNKPEKAWNNVTRWKASSSLGDVFLFAIYFVKIFKFIPSPKY